VLTAVLKHNILCCLYDRVLLVGQPKVTSADGGGTPDIIEKRKNEARKFEFRPLRCGGISLKRAKASSFYTDLPMRAKCKFSCRLQNSRFRRTP